MALRLLPWQPEFGTSMQFDAEPDAAVPTEPPDIRVEESRWVPMTPSGPPSLAVQIVDGVRRAEAHAMDSEADGRPVFGLFGSYGVGAVRCDEGGARILEERSRIERRYLYTGQTAADDLELSVGEARLCFLAQPVKNASTANALVARLNQAMLDDESRLAEDLSEDESVLTLVDGPLRSLRSPGRRVVGYVKRIQQWYVGPEEIELLPTLRAGERTPIFEIPPPPSEGNPGDGRYSWFLRIAELGAHFHPLGGVMRLEAHASLPLASAVALADETARLMPRLASSPVRDPRAPHNLVPVAALESWLTHLLGDRLFVRRLISSAVARPAIEEAYG
jgi:hypothetical protein